MRRCQVCGAPATGTASSGGLELATCSDCGTVCDWYVAWLPTTRARRAAAVVLLAAAALLAAPVPAHAAAATQSDHIEVRHYAPDAGYDRDLLIRCGSQGFVIIEGTSSTRFRHVVGGPDCEGVTSIYVRAGEEWWSTYGGTKLKRFDATGWHNLPEGWSDGDGIYLQKD